MTITEWLWHNNIRQAHLLPQRQQTGLPSQTLSTGTARGRHQAGNPGNPLLPPEKLATARCNTPHGKWTHISLLHHKMLNFPSSSDATAFKLHNNLRRLSLNCRGFFLLHFTTQFTWQCASVRQQSLSKINPAHAKLYLLLSILLHSAHSFIAKASRGTCMCAHAHTHTHTW